MPIRTSSVITLSNAGTNNQVGNHNQLYNDTQMDRYTIQMLASLPGVRCYVDASTALDHPSQQPRLAGLGIFFVNTHVQPTQTIYIKAHMPATQSVIMAEAAALALAALVNNRLGFNNAAFLSDCQQLVHFLNPADQSNPPDWRIKPFTQIFTTCSAQCQAKIYKINWTLNTTVDSLAKHAILESCSNYEPVCSYSRHSHQCPLRDALISITLQGVTILAASCY